MRLFILGMFATAGVWATDMPWRAGVAVISEQQVFDQPDRSDFPLLIADERQQTLVVPVLGYQTDRWSLGTDGGRIRWGDEQASVNLSIDFSDLVLDYQRRFDWFTLTPSLAVTFSDGLGWRLGLDSTVLGLQYGQLFATPEARYGRLSSGAPLRIKEGGANFIATIAARVDNQAYSVASKSVAAEGLADYQVSWSLGGVHFWQLTPQYRYTLVAQVTRLPDDLAAQASSRHQANLVAVLGYRF